MLYLNCSQRELEISAHHEDGGKRKLEQLLQCEVEQQQMHTNIRRASQVRSLAPPKKIHLVVPNLKVITSMFVLQTPGKSLNR